MLYVATTGTEQPSPGGPAKALHGWVVAFDVDDWKQAAAWVATPSSFGGGIWQGSEARLPTRRGTSISSPVMVAMWKTLPVTEQTRTSA